MQKKHTIPESEGANIRAAMHDDPIQMYLNDIYTIGVSLAGLPAASIPCGLSEGLPVGLHIIGDHFCERKVLSAAHQFHPLVLE